MDPHALRDLVVEVLSIDAVTPYQNNPRTHSDHQIDQIASAIVAFGWTNPILIDDQNRIIAGHGRLDAARRLGMGEVPCLRINGLDDEARRALIIADNKIALNAGWDEALLAIELGSLKEYQGLVGFADEELQRLFGTGTNGLIGDEETPPLPRTPVTEAADVWLLGKNRLLCGDATAKTDVEALCAGVTPTLMVTDPPYGVAYDPAWRAKAGINRSKKRMGVVENDDRADWTEAWKLFAGDIAYVWHGALHAAEVERSLDAAGFKVRSQIIWAKDRFALSRGDYHWQHEPCFYAVREGARGGWAGNRSQTTLWPIAGRDEEGVGHSTQKPVECMRRPVENNSSAGQVIYDPFLGSGTSIIAAEKMGRVCYGLEISPGYCDVIVERWQRWTGKTAALADGRSFDTVRRERTQAGGSR